MMGLDNNMEKITSRKTITSNSAKEYEKIINEMNKENQVLSEEIFELKNILTEHKAEIEKSSEVINNFKNILNDGNSCLKSMLTTYFIFIDFYKQLQTVPLANS